jgi:hypothetical protein
MPQPRWDSADPRPDTLLVHMPDMSLGQAMRRITPRQQEKAQNHTPDRTTRCIMPLYDLCATIWLQIPTISRQKTSFRYFHFHNSAKNTIRIRLVTNIQPFLYRFNSGNAYSINLVGNTSLRTDLDSLLRYRNRPEYRFR